MARKTKSFMEPAEPAKIEDRFEDSPEGWAKYFAVEFKAAREEGQGALEWPGLKNWHERAQKIVKRFLDNRKGTRRGDAAKLNLFTANTQTLRALLFGNTPKCDVSRSFDDAADDDSRVASEMLRRVLNAGLEQDTNGLSNALGLALSDRLLPGLGNARVTFSCDFQTVPAQPAKTGPCPACGGAGQIAAPPPPTLDSSMPMPLGAGAPQACPQCQGSGQIEIAPAVPAQEKPCNEKADPSYMHWRDQLYSPSRTWDEMRWWAFGAEMGRQELVETFGIDGQAIPLNAGKGAGSEKQGKKETPWSRAMVWEIWDKERRRLHYFVEGYPKTLQHKNNPTGADPLGLEDFWPFPKPLIANETTSAFYPTPDFVIAQDLYDEADELTNRIRNIVRTVKVAGVYDRANKSVQRLLDEACENELIPVENWAQFLGEKGGLKGSIDLLPIEGMMEVVIALVNQRNLVIELSMQITGMGDVVRGQQGGPETATTSAIKARFASVRLQDFQKEVARFATDLQRIRKEIIAKHFSIETIIKRSNILQSEDGQTDEGKQRIVRAAQLIKDRHLDFRVSVKPEQVALQDFAALKQQRGEVLQALGVYFQSMMPFVQFAAQAGPVAAQAAVKMVVKNAQWMIVGMPGSNGIEANFDEFVSMLEKAAQQPQPPKPPDPKLMTAQVKAKAETTKAQLGVQQAVVDAQAHALKTRLDLAKTQIQHRNQMMSEEAQQRTEALKQINATVPAPLGPIQGGIA